MTDATLKHTKNHINCPICSPAKEGSVTGTRIARDWPFSEAIDQWLEDNKRDLKPNTYRSYADNNRRLKEFFQDMSLDSIHIGNIRAYQHERSKVAGPQLVNSEMSRVQTLMKQLKLWDALKEEYRPLTLKKEKVRQNLSEEEVNTLEAVALKPGKRLVAGHCLIVMMNTTMGFGELKHVRRKDVYLDVDIPYVQVNKSAGGAKNDYRERTIPLNLRSLRSLKWLIARWKKMGGDKDDQYILPHRANERGDDLDFYKPMGHINRAARSIFKEAGLKVQIYDMRSHAISEILSNPNISPQVAQEIAGHISKKMQDRYSKQRLERKLVALEALNARGFMEQAAYNDEVKESVNQA